MDIVTQSAFVSVTNTNIVSSNPVVRRPRYYDMPSDWAYHS